MVKIIIPDSANLIPANRILLPVISEVISNSANPSLISGYAHPHAIAAVRANITTQNGFLNIDVCWVDINCFVVYRDY
jgi:hypothetical protein